MSSPNQVIEQHPLLSTKSLLPPTSERDPLVSQNSPLLVDDLQMLHDRHLLDGIGTSNSCCVYEQDAPSVAESDISSMSGFESDDNVVLSTSRGIGASVPARMPLQWKFHGLTLWLEYEEFDDDLTQAINHAVHVYGTERIPMPHSTAVYGMTHLTLEAAVEKVRTIPTILINGCWPRMDEPIGIRQDIAMVGKPGQVADIAWAEITFQSNDQHEIVIDAIYKHFEVPILRTGRWTPHISLAYDNPEDTVLNPHDTYAYVTAHPTLLASRRVKAISLWDTNGQMADWRCLDRVYLEMDK